MSPDFYFSQYSQICCEPGFLEDNSETICGSLFDCGLYPENGEISKFCRFHSRYHFIPSING